MTNAPTTTTVIVGAIMGPSPTCYEVVSARRRRRIPGLLRGIGPELVAGASDNDPTNVGTAVAVGAATGYQLAWAALLVAPMLGVVESIAAQVGSVARSDLQTLTLKRYGRGVAVLLLVSVVIVNVVTIAADLHAGAAGIGLLVGVQARWFVLPLGLVLTGLLLAGRYDEVVRVLRYLLLGFAVFAVAVVLAHPDWWSLARDSLVPTLSLRRDVLAGALALLGTTLSSYVYVWETIQRGVEEPADVTGGRGLTRMRLAATLSGVYTAVIFWSMLVASAATLGQHHDRVTSARQAAKALRPLAGPLAENLFAIGLLVSAVVALPVLIATTAYVVGAQFDWRCGLSEPVKNAWGFYGVLAASVGLAFAVTLAGISLLDMLVAASVIAGLGTPLGLVILVRLGRDRTVMGSRPISGRMAIAGWAIAAVIGGLGLLYAIGAALGTF